MMAAAVLAYFSRPWSCSAALSRFMPEDPVPYSRFDYHGLGAMSAWLLSLLFAAPVLWLASKVFLTRQARLGLFGRARDQKTTLISVLIGLAIGVPMHAQIAYMIGLPLKISAPVVASSLFWLLMVEIGRTAAVRGDFLGRSEVRVATIIAVVVTAPKLALIVF